MSEDVFELALIESPEDPTISDDQEKIAGAKTTLKYMLRYFDDSIEVSDIDDFIFRVASESNKRGKKIDRLIIGGHGNGGLSEGRPGYGSFKIGKTWVGFDHDKVEAWPKRLRRPATIQPER